MVVFISFEGGTGSRLHLTRLERGDDGYCHHQQTRDAASYQIVGTVDWRIFPSLVINGTPRATTVGVTRTALTAEYLFAANTTRENSVRIASAILDCKELVGPGSLFWIDFAIPEQASGTSPLQFVSGKENTYLYQKDDLQNPLELHLVGSQLVVSATPGYILGDADGNGTVDQQDAMLVLGIASGTQASATPDQQSAGDINGDGELGAADAAMIMYFATHGEWPPIAATTTIPGDVDGDQVVGVKDALALLLIISENRSPTADQLKRGDVNGNGELDLEDVTILLYFLNHGTWPVRPDSASLMAEGSTEVYVQPGRVYGSPGHEVEIPIRLSNGANVAAAEFVVHYGSGLTYQDIRFTDGMQSSVDTSKEGRLWASMASETPLSEGPQTLAWIRFRIEDQATDATMWVEVAGAWLSDQAGRDFTISALDQPVLGGRVGIQGEATGLVYLPLIQR